MVSANWMNELSRAIALQTPYVCVCMGSLYELRTRYLSYFDIRIVRAHIRILVNIRFLLVLFQLVC